MEWLIISATLAIVLLLVVSFLWWVFSADDDHVHHLGIGDLAEDAQIEDWFMGGKRSAERLMSRREEKRLQSWSRRKDSKRKSHYPEDFR